MRGHGTWKNSVEYSYKKWYNPNIIYKEVLMKIKDWIYNMKIDGCENVKVLCENDILYSGSIDKLIKNDDLMQKEAAHSQERELIFRVAKEDGV